MHLRSATLPQVSELRGLRTRERDSGSGSGRTCCALWRGRRAVAARLCDFYKSVLSVASPVVRCASAGVGGW